MQLFKTLAKKGVRITGKAGLLKKINFTLTRNFYGKRIKIPIIREIGIQNLTISEPWMIDLLRKLLNKRKGMFIDVGTNLGQTLIKLRCIHPYIEYIGLEPNPVCVFYLGELIRRNNFGNCTILPVGLFDNNGLLQLDFFNESVVDSSASLIKSFRPGHKVDHRHYVPVLTFETIISALKLGGISTIKIDVEGAELEVLKTLYKTISNYRPIIILEILPVYTNENKMRKERQSKIEQIIFKLEYSIFRVRKTDRDSYNGLHELKTIGIHSDLSQCDYVLVPNELKRNNQLRSSTAIWNL